MAITVSNCFEGKFNLVVYFYLLGYDKNMVRDRLVLGRCLKNKWTNSIQDRWALLLTAYLFLQLLYSSYTHLLSCTYHEITIWPTLGLLTFTIFIFNLFCDYLGLCFETLGLLMTFTFDRYYFGQLLAIPKAVVDGIYDTSSGWP
jgi:hypothetical protein